MLTQDLILVIGIIVAGLAIPSILGSMAERRSPRTAAIAILVGGSLILIAFSQRPGGYTLEEIPEAFIRVVAHYFR